MRFSAVEFGRPSDEQVFPTHTANDAIREDVTQLFTIGLPDPFDFLTDSLASSSINLTIFKF